jgi:hypothetical protein
MEFFIVPSPAMKVFEIISSVLQFCVFQTPSKRHFLLGQEVKIMHQTINNISISFDFFIMLFTVQDSVANSIDKFTHLAKSDSLAGAAKNTIYVMFSVFQCIEKNQTMEVTLLVRLTWLICMVCPCRSQG